MLDLASGSASRAVTEGAEITAWHAQRGRVTTRDPSLSMGRFCSSYTRKQFENIHTLRRSLTSHCGYFRKF